MISNGNNNEYDQHGGSNSGYTTSSKKECTSCEQNNNNVENITEGIDRIVLGDTSTCANCGKGEEKSSKLKKCVACKLVKYCSRECQAAHRPQHKKACKRRVAELRDEQLFKEVDREECPICFLTLPIEGNESIFKACCGKTICIGCIYAMHMSEGKDLCAFCRTPPATSDEDVIKRLKNLMDKGNAESFNHLGGLYAQGINGMPQDIQKTIQLLLKAGEIGCAQAYYNLGISYDNGRGIEVDKKKAKHYYELAAMKGDVHARYNLGCAEWEKGNLHRAMKHFIMAAKAGYEKSLDNVKQGFKSGLVTKDEFAATLRAYHERRKEMESDAREEAAAEMV